jgi:hypothetical protein
MRIDQYPHVRKLLLDVCIEMSQGAGPEITDQYFLNFIEDQLKLARIPDVDLEAFDTFLGEMPWDRQVELAFSSDPDEFRAVTPKGCDGEPLANLLDLIS